MSTRLRPTPLEVASMTVVGLDPETPPLPAAPDVSPREALEAAVLPALMRPPCVVAFSGGRDSSLLLAVAAHVARRERLAPPVALTLRFPQSPTAEESEWQELVIGHLGIADWVRRDIHDELDFVGPVAQRAMLRHGVLWPANLHFVVPPAEQAAGGSLVTGVGGDRVLLSGPDEAAGRSRARARLRGAVRGAYRSLPVRARAPHHARRVRANTPWLRGPAVDAVVARTLSQPWEPRRLDARLDHVHRERLHALTRHGIELLAGDEDARAVTPFLEPGFLAALARFLGADGVGGRTALMRVIAGDLLPERLLTRPTKAVFPEAYCNRHTREFVRTWRGGGVDETLVDVDRLRALLGDGTDHAWLGRSAVLLQSAWLAEAVEDAGTTGKVRIPPTEARASR
jgi:asparagine synthase (glutamine-hydrolysing)